MLKLGLLGTGVGALGGSAIGAGVGYLAGGALDNVAKSLDTPAEREQFSRKLEENFGKNR